jgi:hypothetical protein
MAKLSNIVCSYTEGSFRSASGVCAHLGLRVFAEGYVRLLGLSMCGGMCAGYV